MNEFERACDKMSFKNNGGMSKVLVVGMDQRTSGERIRVDGVEMEEVDKFK